MDSNREERRQASEKLETMDWGRLVGVSLAVVAVLIAAARPKQAPLPSAYYLEKLYGDRSRVIDVTGRMR